MICGVLVGPHRAVSPCLKITATGVSTAEAKCIIPVWLQNSRSLFFMVSANSFIERTGKRSIVAFACLLIRSINGSSPGPQMNKTSPFFDS